MLVEIRKRLVVIGTVVDKNYLYARSLCGNEDEWFGLITSKIGPRWPVYSSLVRIEGDDQSMVAHESN